MKENDFFESISPESAKLLKQLFVHTPIGTMILNEAQEIVFINDRVLAYFNDDYEQAYTYLSKFYKAAPLENETNLTTTHHDVDNFVFLKSIHDACKHKKALNNIQMHYKMKEGNQLKNQWFDLSLLPFECDGHSYVCVKTIDLTKLMQYKVEADTLHMLNDADNSIEKDRFHENVMTCFKENCHKDGQAYFIMTKLKDALWIQEKFGFLWKNEHLASFYIHLTALLGPKDYACRFSENQFLIFIPCVGNRDVTHFIQQLDKYHDEHFQLKEVLTHKIMKLDVRYKNVRKMVESDDLYKHYFKAIAVIENLEDTGTCEITF